MGVFRTDTVTLLTKDNPDYATAVEALNQCDETPGTPVTFLSKRIIQTSDSSSAKKILYFHECSPSGTLCRDSTIIVKQASPFYAETMVCLAGIDSDKLSAVTLKEPSKMAVMSYAATDFVVVSSADKKTYLMTMESAEMMYRFEKPVRSWKPYKPATAPTCDVAKA